MCVVGVSGGVEAHTRPFADLPITAKTVAVQTCTCRLPLQPLMCMPAIAGVGGGVAPHTRPLAAPTAQAAAEVRAGPRVWMTLLW